MVKKLKEFINDKNYDNRSGDIIASVCGFLVVSVSWEVFSVSSKNLLKKNSFKKSYGKETFELFFKYVYDNLKKFKEGRNCKFFKLILIIRNSALNSSKNSWSVH